ncbi:MAG: response regulator [Deltaproteobacteria bacterium]|nr:response regulator [Deltaproteobacteria bacterium]
MPNLLRRLFRPPSFIDERDALVAELIYVIVLTNVGINVLFSVAAPFVQEEPGPVWAASVLLTAFWVFTLGLVRWRRVRMAAWAVTSGHFLFMTVASVLGGGVDAPGVVFFFSTIVIATLTLGLRQAVAFAGLSVFAVVAFHLAGSAQLLPEPQFVPTSTFKVVVFTFNALFITVLLLLALRRLERSHRVVADNLARLTAAQDQLLQARKMEAIGTLAGGVAHDFNNILTVIAAYADMLKQGVGRTDEERTDLGEIQLAVDRAASLTHQLLAFSSRQVLQARILDLNSVIGAMEGMLRRIIGEDIELRTTLSPDLGFVEADRTQIEQVVLNLVVNAREAMPKGGLIIIETTNVDLDPTWAGQETKVETGPYVQLVVRDTGVGMAEETQSQIFEPFFTTREVGEGTGLGLSTVYGIVKQSGGHIQVHSQIGAGSAFEIHLPQVSGVSEPFEDAPPWPDGSRGTETVLVVEDEDTVRDLVRKTLQQRGYTVLEACDGPEAIGICEGHEGDIDLLLTDVVMPGGMRGPDLAQHLREICEGLPVLYMSGYTQDAIANHGTTVHFLAKPFTPSQLLQRVREVLEG